MNLALKKIELIEWLTQIEDEATLIQIDTFLKDSVKLKKMTDEEFKSMLDKAEVEYSNGKFTNQEDLEKEILNW